MRRNKGYLATLLALLPATTLACSGVPYSVFNYQKWGDGTKYAVGDSKEDFNIYFPDILLPQIKFSQLRRVPDLVIHEYDKPGEINNDYIAAAAYSEDIKNGYWRFDWLTDGRHILWAGKIVHNPAGTPEVDVKTFRAYGRFAADKYSLYFDGERTDDNRGEKQVDLDSVQPVGSIPQGQDSAGVLKDRHNLYYRGRWLGSNKDYAILGVKTWDQRGPMITHYSCDLGYNPGPWDTLLRTQTQVFLNGTAVSSDPQSFRVVRWMPGTLLIYRDKTGTHRYAFGKNCLDNFVIEKDKVTWLKREASEHGDDCRVEVISGVDPEQFRRISRNAAQYKDSLYQFQYVSPVDRELTVTKIIDPKLQLKSGQNIVGNRIYYVDSDDVNIFDLEGELRWLIKPDGHESETFARDNRYFYFFSLNGYGGMRRIETCAYDAAHIDSRGNLVTVEGNYAADNNFFTPTRDLKNTCDSE